MISVCISISNSDVSTLIGQLEVQIQSSPFPVEIILIDNASSASIRKRNFPFTKKYKHIQKAKKLGQSALRNSFLDHAQHEYLLFINGDVLLISDLYLPAFFTKITESEIPASCLSAGSLYSSTRPATDKRLHWKAAMEETKVYESMPSLSSNNLLVHRDILSAHPLEESIHGSKREDLLTQHRWKKQGIQIDFVDNPVLNISLKTNAIFMYETKKEIADLYHIWHACKQDKEMVRRVPFMDWIQSIDNVRGTSIGLLVFSLSKGILTRLLRSGRGSSSLYKYFLTGCFLKERKKYGGVSPLQQQVRHQERKIQSIASLF